MTIEFLCGSCQKHYRVKDEMAGKRAKCQQCGATIEIPIPPAMPPAVDLQAHAAPPRSPAAPPRPVGMPSSSESIRGSGDFEFEISQRPDFALITVKLQPGQKVFAEPSAMASMDPTITLQAGFKGGLKRTLGRALGGESLIINTFTATGSPGEVTFAAGQPGDAAYYRLKGGTLSPARPFMLHSEGVDLTGKWQGAQGVLQRRRPRLAQGVRKRRPVLQFLRRVLQVDVTDQYIVDTGYIVAFEDTLQYRVSVLPGLPRRRHLEDPLLRLARARLPILRPGPGVDQTRHVHPFLAWVNPFRPAKSN